jgi:DNA-directed RNA polymerase
MAFRDTIGGAAVNILPSDKPSDIYQLVADKTIVELERMADRNDRAGQNSQEEGPTDAELAQWWLDFGITRKITKRNCMTFPPSDKPHPRTTQSPQ